MPLITSALLLSLAAGVSAHGSLVKMPDEVGGCAAAAAAGAAGTDDPGHGTPGGVPGAGAGSLSLPQRPHLDLLGKQLVRQVLSVA